MICFPLPLPTAMRGYWARDDPAVLLIVMAYLAGVWYAHVCMRYMHVCMLRLEQL